MNEDAYRQTYYQVNDNRCVYEKMLLLRYGNCQYAQKLLLAEREAMSCLSNEGQKQCLMLLNKTRQKARFALQLVQQLDSPLPHAKELQVQAGGLYGLQQFMEHKNTAQTEELSDEILKFSNESSQPIKNITLTIQSALEKFAEIEKFPFTEMIKAVKHFSLPKRRRGKKNKS